jgi:hypothetical protein
MRNKLMFVIAGAGAAILFAADQPKKEPTEFDRLKAKVTLLEGRVTQLENRIELLSHTPKVVFGTPNAAPFAPDSTVPPNLGEREVNGLKVYAVPLSGGGKSEGRQ